MQFAHLKIATVESYIKIIFPFTVYSPWLDIEDLPRYLELKFNPNQSQSQSYEKVRNTAKKHEAILFKFLSIIPQNKTYT